MKKYKKNKKNKNAFPSDWGAYWNYYNQDNTLTNITWGATRAQYDAA